MKRVEPSSVGPRPPSHSPSLKVSALLLALLWGCNQSEQDSVAVVSRDSTSNRAWWLSTAIEPGDTLLSGIPVSVLDSSWATATLLSREILPEIDEMDEYGGPGVEVGFAVDRDLNGDGVVDHVGVGVYRNRLGEKGRFAVVLTRGRAGLWESDQTAVFGGDNDITFLIDDGSDTLRWNDCLECGATPVRIFWDGSEYVFEWADN